MDFVVGYRQLPFDIDRHDRWYVHLSNIAKRECALYCLLLFASEHRVGRNIGVYQVGNPGRFMEYGGLGVCHR